MLCNKCYEDGKKSDMKYVGKVNPQSPFSKGALLNPLTGEVEGKPKFKCPRCGYYRSGRGKSWADLQEELISHESKRK